ncbi:YlbF family regulator [Terrilactibacillus sp. S3-3]|nr:YlbF family regulator [Terrilactibacillus sp. S3-3]
MFFIKYLDCKEKVAKNEEAQDLVRRFMKVREKYDEVQRFGRYHPDYKAVITQMMEAKRDVDMNDLISSYKEAEDELQQLLNEVSLIFARSVSESIKVPTGDPFF